MAIWRIALKEILSSVRNRQTFLFMLALPIILMLILGAGLSNAFSSKHSVGEVRLLYKATFSENDMSAYWDSFTKAIGKEGVEVVPIRPGMDWRQEVSSGRYTAYATIDKDGIAFFGSSKNTVESGILQGMLVAFADRYALGTAAFQASPGVGTNILKHAAESKDFIQETTLVADRKPGSIDYYAVSMTTMIALFSIISANYLFGAERARKTAIRLMAAPISKGEILVGKMIGNVFINTLCVLVVVLFSKFVYHAYWGNHFWLVLLALLTEVLLAVSLGLGIGFLLTKQEGSYMVVMIFLQCASFFGGAYFPIENTEGILTLLTNLSPLRWINTALLELIYMDNIVAVWKVIGLNLGIAAVFLVLTVISIRRREAF
ncbi:MULTISPECIES: ABC transporter permease [Brevibacillus]|jgi:ABC-type multidrug transport system, permease component|uniref:ABC transporter permease n=1 Tax=Brevibacillus TaxID=55080 RepID=UPI00156ABD5C|nr:MULTISPECIES: ABC transporter permease [Brevibacillus]MDH6352774.1 ABC-2 type transport system permease protein [Brevibacillus sp. 1238]MDR4999866.1 ABC transporter permease subunit [Brevibacillus parabrevis]MED2255036.1 ABC transporter permease [Brevibacillus parabrevis]UED69836.1 ABC transporter permease [Brevibacillus sp. HD3.3A]